jgi:hypothetical protein
MHVNSTQLNPRIINPFIAPANSPPILLIGANSLPVLPGEAVENIVAAAVARGPLAQDELDAQPKLLSIVVDSNPLAGGNGRKSSVYHVGNLVLRDNQGQGSNRLLVRSDGTQLISGANLPVTLEMALFPYLFPNGTGAYQHTSNAIESLAAYLMFRMKCFFSPWTLFKPYLLMMFQVRQVVHCNA